MSEIHSSFDREFRFYASVILTRGRNEVQIFPLSEAAGAAAVVDGAHVSRFELEAHQQVVAISWAYGVEEGARKKRAAGAAAAAATTATSSTAQRLVVALADGELLVFAPGGAAPRSLGTNLAVQSMCASPKNPSVWILTLDAPVALHEVAAATGKILKTFKFDAEPRYAAVRSLATANHNLQHLVVTGHDATYLVDPSKPKKSHLWTNTATAGATTWAQSTARPHILATAVELEGPTHVYLINAASGKVMGRSVTLIARHVTQLVFVGERLMIVSAAGVQVVPVATMEVGGEMEVPVIRMEDELFVAVAPWCGGLCCVWYDKREPRFVPIEWGPETGDVVVAAVLHKEAAVPAAAAAAPAAPLRADAGTDADAYADARTHTNIPAAELPARLSSLLARDDAAAVTALCALNDNVAAIRSTLRQLAGLPDMLSRLFTIVSGAVAQRPRRTLVLAVWLKWLLLTHGGYLAARADQGAQLRHLHDGLAAGIKQLPQLLSLQGRLNLLLSQMELRQSREGDEGDDGDDTTVNNTAIEAEDSVVYANGETDDLGDDLGDVLEEEEEEEEDDDEAI